MIFKKKFSWQGEQPLNIDQKPVSASYLRISVLYCFVLLNRSNSRQKSAWNKEKHHDDEKNAKEFPFSTDGQRNN